MTLAKLLALRDKMEHEQYRATNESIRCGSEAVAATTPAAKRHARKYQRDFEQMARGMANALQIFDTLEI